MAFTRFLMTTAGALAASVVGFAAAAQSDLTADEIKDAFNKQKTRGLVIVPAGQEPTQETQAAAQEYTEVARDDQVNIKISFDFDSAALRDNEKPKLTAMCEAMQSVEVSVFQIIGHTDSSGSAAYNENLSLLRAEEVKRYLVSNCGIAETRLQAIGMGETTPFDPEDPRADANRRVEFQALG